MKILILGFTKLKYMPYSKFYLENIDKKKNDVHFLYWNRDLAEEDRSAYEGVTFHELKLYQEDDVKKYEKICNFIKYKSFANRIIIDLKPDFIYILHTFPGVLTYRLLKKEYDKRYIFDYRDSTYEMFPPFRYIISGLVKHSCYTFVSSDGFRKLLPKSEEKKIYTSHNILIDSVNYRNTEMDAAQSDVIRIAFWGIVRNEELNMRIILGISQDKRFELHYYGREQQTVINLRKFVNKNKINNVFFHGEYKPEDRYEFSRQTDIIHNIYCDANMMLAMSNKYYDGIVFRIPQICMTNSFMGNLVLENGVGMVCNPNDEKFTDEIYEYYTGLNREEFITKCDKALSKVLMEYEYDCKIISEEKK